MQIRATYLQMHKDVAKLEEATLAKLKNNRLDYWLKYKPENNLTSEEKIRRSKILQMSEVTDLLAEQRKFDQWVADNLRADSSEYSINARLREVAPGFSVPNPQKTGVLRMIDPNVRDANGGDVHQMIDNDEDVWEVTDPLKLGDAYLREFLLDF